MKQRRTATSFLHTSAVHHFFLILESCELYEAVHTIEWQIAQSLVRPDRVNWDQVMDHF